LICFYPYNRKLMAKIVDWESRIGRRLRLRDLHIFFAVVESGSMAKAGAVLRVTQPAVSKAIGDLEAAVGVRLLDRSPRGVEPTVYGNALLECGSAAFDELRQGVRKIEHLADPTSGELRIGCQALLAGTMLPPIIEQLCHRYPRLSFDVALMSSPNFEFPALRHRTIDLMLAALPGPVVDNKLGDDVTVEVVFEDRIVVAVGMQSPWSRRRKIELAELVDEPWFVSPAGSWTRPFVEAAFAAKGLAMPQITVASYSVPLQYSLCATGKFITATSGLTLHFNGKQQGVKALPIDLPIWPWPVAIVTLKNRTLSPIVKVFIEYVHTFFAQLRQQVERQQ
jgi:DNA-binding transcriptional LysR family regulator